MLIWVVLLSVGANLLAGYELRHLPWLDRRVQMQKFSVAASFESYFLKYRRCPVVILGSSIAGELPPEGWERPDVCTITLTGLGSLLGLEVMARIPATPRVLFVESNLAFRDAPAEQQAALTDPVPSLIREWFPLTSAQGNWINALWRGQYPIERNLQRPTESWEDWRAMRRPYSDVYVSIYGDPVGEWGRNRLDENLKRTEELIAEMERRGTKIIFFEAPLDPRLASLPVIALWADKMHAAFADHEWVMDPTGKYYLNDGMHFTSGSGMDFFNLLMAHVPPPSESGNPMQ